MTIKLRQRPLPGRLRYLAELLDQKGDDEVTRFAIATVLFAIAVELELPAGSVCAGVTNDLEPSATE